MSLNIVSPLYSLKMLKIPLIIKGGVWGECWNIN